MARRPTAPRTGDDPAAAWLSDAERQRSALYTCRRVPIFYLAITKCGSTYLKNVMYALDHGVSHPDGEDIHETERGLMRASAVAPEAIRNSPYVFTVLRDPTRRFLSMYFDKIYGDGPRNFPKLREKIAERAGLDLARGLDAEAHHENCLRFVSWIGRNIAGETDLQKNYHWRPQIGRVRRVSCFPLARLTLEGLDWQLPALLRPVEPEIGAVLAGVSERNRSAKALDPRRIISSELVAALQEVYPRDFAIHSEAASNWRAWSRDRAGDMPVPHPDPRWMRVRSLGGQDFVAGTPAADAALRVAGASLRDMASDAAPRASLLVVDPLDRLWQTLVQ
ncbi:MAG: sulfotransferase family 2 domain-containing protein, partial [Rubricella sp.]